MPKAPLTEEDRLILESRWHNLSGRGRINPLWYIQWQADTIDAELMLDLLKTRTSLLGRLLISKQYRRALLAYQSIQV